MLFIDEAYRLNPKLGGAYMSEVLDEIVQLLTEEAFKVGARGPCLGKGPSSLLAF